MNSKRELTLVDCSRRLGFARLNRVRARSCTRMEAENRDPTDKQLQGIGKVFNSTNR